MAFNVPLKREPESHHHVRTMGPVLKMAWEDLSAPASRDGWVSSLGLLARCGSMFVI